MRRIIFAAVITALGSISQAAQIYKWVDAQGVTHFDAQPPVNQPAQQIETHTPPPAPASSASPSSVDSEPDQQTINAQVKKQVAGAEARRTENCTVLRTNLAQLQNNPRVREQVEGGMKRLSEDERKARISETQTAIGESCQ